MATDKATVAYVCDQMQAAGVISARTMFGEYAVYCDGRLVGLICDDTLYLKPTPGAVALLGEGAMGPPYPGAKDHYIIDEGLEDAGALAGLVAVIAGEVPAAKPKKPKAGASRPKKPAQPKPVLKKEK